MYSQRCSVKIAPKISAHTRSVKPRSSRTDEIHRCACVAHRIAEIICEFFLRSVHGQERRRNQIYRKNSKQHAGRVWGLGCTGNRHATCRIQTLCSSVDTSARKIDEMTEEKKLSDCRERIQSKPNQVRNDVFLSPRADDSEERRSSVINARIQDNP